MWSGTNIRGQTTTLFLEYIENKRGTSPIVLDSVRQAAYRAVFRAELDADAIDDIRLALNQNQPLGSNRFHRQIEKKLGERREARQHGATQAGGGCCGSAAGTAEAIALRIIVADPFGYAFGYATMEAWMQSLSQSISSAFLAEMERLGR